MQPPTDIPTPDGLIFTFQVFGLFPLSLTGGPVINVILQCISLGNCLVIAAIALCSLYFAPDIFDTTNTIGLFVDIIQIMAPILTHLAICCEALLRRESYTQFWVQFERICRGVERFQGPSLRGDLKSLYQRTRIKLLLLFLVPLALEIRILWGIFGNFWFFSRLAAEFSFIGCRLSFLQLCLYIALINWLLQLLAEEVQRISNESRSALKSVEREMDNRVAYRRVQWVQEAAREVVELTAKLNLCYRWSLVANLTNNFLSITIAFYWNYRSLYFNNLIYQAGGRISCAWN